MAQDRKEGLNHETRRDRGFCDLSGDPKEVKPLKDLLGWVGAAETIFNSTLPDGGQVLKFIINKQHPGRTLEKR
jgi:hypothetical protein